jgi:hypothetical protein
MRLRLVKEPFDHPDYLYELKRDGFRAVVYIEDGECKLVSHNMKLLRFASLRDSLANGHQPHPKNYTTQGFRSSCRKPFLI